jgi:hypothetical protein
MTERSLFLRGHSTLVTLHAINARMTYDIQIAKDHISAKTMYVMWIEEERFRPETSGIRSRSDNHWTAMFSQGFSIRPFAEDKDQ